MAKAKKARALDPKKQKIAETVLTYFLSYVVLIGLSHFLVAPKVPWLPPMPLALAAHGLIFLVIGIFSKDSTSLISTIASFADLLIAGYLYMGLWGAVIGFAIWLVFASIPLWKNIGAIKPKKKTKQKQPVVNVTTTPGPRTGDFVDHRVAFQGDHPNGQAAQVGYSLQEIIGMGDVTLTTEALKAESESRRLAVEEKKIAMEGEKLAEERIRDRRTTWERWLKEERITQEEFDRKMALLGEEGFSVPEIQSDLPEEELPDFEMDFDTAVVEDSSRTRRRARSGSRRSLFNRRS